MKFGRWQNSDSDWGGGLTSHIEKNNNNFYKMDCSTAVAGAALGHGIALLLSSLWFWAVQRVKTTFYICIFVVVEFIFDIIHNLITIWYNELVF